MGENVLIVDSLSLTIKNRTILDNVQFKVQRGTITAIMGHNGAGKSSTLKSIMGIIEPEQGNIYINDVQLKDDNLQYKRQFAYIPEEPILLEEFTVHQFLQFYATLYEVDEKDFNCRAEYYLTSFDMMDRAHDFPEDLSKGMRQKVNIIASLIVDVPLLIIDEPFIGLDDKASTFLISELKKKAGDGTTILLTSHQIEKIKEICDRYIILKNGRVQDQGDISSLRLNTGEEEHVE